MIEEEIDVKGGHTEKPIFESSDLDLKDTLRIKNLKKIFDGKKAAVNDISISMFKG
jgi:hypothetical protein